MHRLLRAIAFLILFGPAMRAQENMIMNGSFESVSGAVVHCHCVDTARYWYSIRSPDLFSLNSNDPLVKLPNNYAGKQYPAHGSNYVGIAQSKYGSVDTFEDEYIYNKEYLLGTLSKETKKGREYTFTFKISWAEVSEVKAKEAFVLLIPYVPTAAPFTSPTQPSVSILSYFEDNYNKATFFPINSDTASWQEVSVVIESQIRAKGFIFGLRDSVKHMIYTLPVKNVGYLYYFFDDFSLVEIPDTSLFLELPNTFSPNADGQNDEWHPRSRNFDHFELQVFNRYGTLVFQSNGEQVQWDGLTLSGEPAAEGVYFIQLSATDRYGELHERQETVHLFR